MNHKQLYVDFKEKMGASGLDGITRLLQVISESTEHISGQQGYTTRNLEMELWTAIVVQETKVISTTVSNPADGSKLCEAVIASPAVCNPEIAATYRRALLSSSTPSPEANQTTELLGIPTLIEIPQANSYGIVESVHIKKSTASYRLYRTPSHYDIMSESRNTVQVLLSRDGSYRLFSFRDLSLKEAQSFWRDEGALCRRADNLFKSKKMTSVPKGRLALSVDALMMLLQNIAPLMSLDAHEASQGLLSGMSIGSKIVGSCVNIFDEPRNPAFPDVYLFDMQGVPTHNRTLVSSGKLAGLLGSVESSARTHMDFYGNAWSDVTDPITLAPRATNIRISVDGPRCPDFDCKIIEFSPETTINPESGDIVGRALGLTSASERTESAVFPLRLNFLDIFSNPCPIGPTILRRGFASPEISFEPKA